MNRRTTVELQVDGTDLGYNHSFETESDAMGLWKRQNGISSYQALKFVWKRRAAGNKMPPVGCIKTTFYETIYFDDKVKLQDCDVSKCLNQAFDAAPPVECGDKKAFTSISGSISVSNDPMPAAGTKWTNRRECGKYLGELTIHYTSTVGLSLLGILAPIVSVAESPSSAAVNDCTPKRKRVRIEASRVVTPSSVARRANSDCEEIICGELIDLTGED